MRIRRGRQTGEQRDGRGKTHTRDKRVGMTPTFPYELGLSVAPLPGPEAGDEALGGHLRVPTQRQHLRQVQETCAHCSGKTARSEKCQQTKEATILRLNH